MDRLKFYNIDDKYIAYLYNFVKRPYIEIVLEINGIKYFAPMVFAKTTT